MYGPNRDNPRCPDCDHPLYDAFGDEYFSPPPREGEWATCLNVNCPSRDGTPAAGNPTVAISFRFHDGAWVRCSPPTSDL